MILAIDVGNTTTAVGLLEEDGTLRFRSSVDTAAHCSADHYAVELLSVFLLNGAAVDQVTGAIVSCVVPPLERSVTAAVTRLTGKAPLVVGPGIRTGMNIRADMHTQLGSDIVACAVAAMARYPDPIVVVDLGTATTFSLLRGGVYEGCAIVPGVRLGLEALAERAAALPPISIETPPGPLGRNTEDAMRAGVLYGNAGLVDSMVDRFEDACGAPLRTVVATGGNAPLILPHCRRAILHEPSLLLHGLYLLYRKNSKRRREGTV